MSTDNIKSSYHSKAAVIEFPSGNGWMHAYS